MMIYLYAIKIGEKVREEKIHSLVSVLSEERKEKTWKYRRKADQNRSILGEALVRYLLWKHYGLSGKEIHFRYGEYGKPFLTGVDGIWFNLSHAGKWVLCGLGNVPLGVDVEGNVSEFMPVAKKFFTKDEYEYILAYPSEKRHDIFCKIWTLKESYVKCTGKGLYTPFDSFQFDFPAQGIRMYRNRVLCRDYLFQSWQLDSDHRVALCVQDQSCNVWHNEISLVSVDELAAWKELL